MTVKYRLPSGAYLIWIGERRLDVPPRRAGLLQDRRIYARRVWGLDLHSSITRGETTKFRRDRRRDAAIQSNRDWADLRRAQRHIIQELQSLDPTFQPQFGTLYL